MKIINVVSKWLGATAIAVAATTAQAAFINVGGVVWDPDSSGPFPILNDFFSSGSLFETIAGAPGTQVTGQGIFDRINSNTPNAAAFCPGCELTFTFSMDVVSITPTGGTSADFVFDNLVLNVFVDSTPDYLGTNASAADGNLWLELTLNGLLTGDGDNLGTGSDLGDGSGLLDVTGGLAAANFDTNTRLNGTDFSFTSSFQPSSAPGIAPLQGTWELIGDSVAVVPVPGSMFLMSLGLLGLGFSRRRQSRASA